MRKQDNLQARDYLVIHPYNSQANPPSDLGSTIVSVALEPSTSDR